MSTEQPIHAEPLDEFRTRRRALRASLAAAQATREREHAATADHVAAQGVPPKGWPTRRAELDSNVSALSDGVARIETDLRAALAAVRLAVAKMEQQRIPLARQLDELYAERGRTLAAAAQAAALKQPMPDHAAAFAAIEGSINDTLAQLAALEAAIAEAGAPLHRHEHDEINDRAHAA